MLVVLGALAYRRAVVSGRGRVWPVRRTLCWVLGWAAVALAVTGPLAVAAHQSFTAHMGTHLLLGMVAPLLLVLAAPVTVALRVLPVRAARRLSAVLRSRPVAVSTEPVVALTLNLGGLVLLYLTPVYDLMHQHALLHAAVHLHTLAAGTLLMVAVLSPDPRPHRRSLRHRTVVLVVALAAHDIVAKHLYAHPPAGVESAERGAMLMYYGGDAVDVVALLVLGFRWYRRTRPRPLPVDPALA